MRMCLYLLVSLALSAHAVSAQTVEWTAALDGLGWGNISAQSVETDGDPLTREFLVEQIDPMGDLFPHRLRVVAVRPSKVCPGPWFTVERTLPPFHLKRRDARDIIEVPGRLVLPFVNIPVTIIRLDTPPC